MSIRAFPTGPVLTPHQFTQAALDRPLSFWATAGGSAADAILQTPGLGTAIRDFSTPDLAREVVGGGRGGVRWRDKTVAEVAAEGDTLYDTEDKFKASPNYRPEIPFEKGMTASRAKAMAEMQDVAKVRQFYASKRPVAGFLGTLGGSALDPINYIPIVGEVAASAAVARVGRIAGRAVIGAGDAAANSAIFQLLTADQRAKFGDDVSWAAIATNAAFAAMAGAVIGGGIGAVSIFRHWTVDRPAVVPPRAVPLDTAASAVATVRAPADFTMAGEATARLQPVRIVAAPVDQVLSRVETAAMRTKSAEVMNDALHGMIHDGEVRLGERAQSHIAEMQAAVGRASTPSKPKPMTVLEFIAANGGLRDDGGELTAREARRLVSERGFSDTELAEIVSELESKSGTGSQGGFQDAGQQGGAGGQGLSGENVSAPRGGGQDAPQEAALGTSTNFSVPAPEPAPQGLLAAYAKIEVNHKVAADPANAELARAVTDAKAEGFDPETNSHDLELDIEALRAQGAVTSEEEAALKAIDETHAGATAWEDVMNVARTCVTR